jgi:hypothetical protein
MSQGNVELLYRAADAFNRRDLDVVLALTDDDARETGFKGRKDAAVTGQGGTLGLVASSAEVAVQDIVESSLCLVDTACR